jgi:multiple sugar transport system permease protein
MNTRSARRRFSFSRFSAFAFLAFAVCFYGIPLLWLFIAGTRSEASLLSGSPFALGSWEMFSQTWINLTTYNNFRFGKWAFNSLMYAVFGVTLSLVACIPAGYVLALFDFPGRKLVLVLTLIAMITPSAAVVLPIFLEMKFLGLNNTAASLILATSFFPFGVYLSYVFFSTSLPAGIMDSGRVDGCTPFQLFTRIALPLAPSLIALVAFFSFLGNWNNYFLAFVLLSDDNLYNLPVGLTALVSGSGALSNLPANIVPIKKPEVILASILVVLPVFLLFLVSQRFVRAGLLSGAEKG